MVTINKDSITLRTVNPTYEDVVVLQKAETIMAVDNMKDGLKAKGGGRVASLITFN